MLKIVLNLILLLTIQFFCISEAYALTDLDVKQFLLKREQLWPSWKLPKLSVSGLKQDLIYPNWFEGDWLVIAEDLDQVNKETTKYIVNFYKNETGNIVGNRSKNSESIGKAIFGEKLIKVKNDPKSFNNQIIYLSDNQYIESRITGRSQILDSDLFFADEFVIQTVYAPEASRVNQVEILSKFYRCDINEDLIQLDNKKDICGIQYSATYGSKVGNTSVNAISTHKYKLTFKYLGN